MVKDPNVAKIVKEALDKGTIIIGQKQTMTRLGNAELSSVVLASNMTPETKKEVDHLAKLTNTSVLIASKTNEELGIICKKPFNISVIGILKK